MCFSKNPLNKIEWLIYTVTFSFYQLLTIYKLVYTEYTTSNKRKRIYD